MPRTRSRMPKPIPAENLEAAARVLRVLAHPQRMRMVELLLHKPVPVSTLAERIGMAPAAVSQHLNHMAAHGIVLGERDGRQVLYSVISPEARYLIDCISNHA
jgi:DNA-binding transcriptional ArsR family regulator